MRSGNPNLSAYATRFLAENKERGTLDDLSDENLERSFAGCVKPLDIRFYNECRLEIAKFRDV
jgi:hypothetical protein